MACLHHNCAEPEYASSLEYVEHARLCVNDILSRSMGHGGMTPVSRGVAEGLSTLQSAIQSGASFKRLWCDMPKVCSQLMNTSLVEWVFVAVS